MAQLSGFSLIFQPSSVSPLNRLTKPVSSSALRRLGTQVNRAKPQAGKSIATRIGWVFQKRERVGGKGSVCIDHLSGFGAGRRLVNERPGARAQSAHKKWRCPARRCQKTAPDPLPLLRDSLRGGGRREIAEPRRKPFFGFLRKPKKTPGERAAWRYRDGKHRGWAYSSYSQSTAGSSSALIFSANVSPLSLFFLPAFSKAAKISFFTASGSALIRSFG